MSNEIRAEIESAAQKLCHYPSGPSTINSCCPGIGRCEMDAAIAEIARLRAWRDAINDALTDWLDSLRDNETPKDALRRLVAYEVTAALDPAVSQAAADLVATARREGMEKAASEAQARAKFWMSGNNEEARFRYADAGEIAAAICAAAKEVKP